jgi:hypothetical protein
MSPTDEPLQPKAPAAVGGAFSDGRGPVEPQKFQPVIDGMLLTGGKPRYLSARITGGHGFSSEISEKPSWSPPNKIVAKRLAPYLEWLDAKGVSR